MNVMQTDDVWLKFSGQPKYAVSRKREPVILQPCLGKTKVNRPFHKVFEALVSGFKHSITKSVFDATQYPVVGMKILLQGLLQPPGRNSCPAMDIMLIYKEYFHQADSSFKFRFKTKEFLAEKETSDYSNMIFVFLPDESCLPDFYLRGHFYLPVHSGAVYGNEFTTRVAI